MPQSNNQNNYLPRLYSHKLNSKIPKPSKSLTANEIHRKSLHDSRTDYGNTRSHRALTSLANEKYIYEIKPDPSYIYIQDPKLKQLIIMLLKSESQRATNNISPRVLTQVDHQGYSILFSKTGSIPIDNIPREFSPKLNHEKKLDKNELKNDQNTSKANKNEISTKTRSTQTDNYLLNFHNLFYADSKGNEYYIAEVYDELTQKLSHYPFIMKLPFHVQMLIKNDLEKNPIESGDRPYKIVVNNNFNHACQSPRVLRILVRNVKDYKNEKTELTNNTPLPTSPKTPTLSVSSSNSLLPDINNASTVKYMTYSPSKNDYKVFLIKKEKRKVQIRENYKSCFDE